MDRIVMIGFDQSEISAVDLQKIHEKYGSSILFERLNPRSPAEHHAKVTAPHVAAVLMLEGRPMILPRGETLVAVPHITVHHLDKNPNKVRVLHQILEVKFRTSPHISTRASQAA